MNTSMVSNKLMELIIPKAEITNTYFQRWVKEGRSNKDIQGEDTLGKDTTPASEADSLNQTLEVHAWCLSQR